jgi:hypothetical protein
MAIDTDKLRALGLADDAHLADLFIAEAGEEEAGELNIKRAYEIAWENKIPGEAVSKVRYWLRQQLRQQKK